MTRPSTRPTLRGVLHQYAFFVSLVAGGLLVARAPSPRAAWAAGVYGGSLSALLGVSALFHRVTWSVTARRWMSRLDHAMIGVLIAGTFTPFGALAMSDGVSTRLLGTVWSGAAGSMVLHAAWIDAPKWLSAALYLAIGWVGVAATPDLVHHAGWAPAVLLLLGGCLYSLGAVVYAVRRPDPVPAVFGYHEVFHALVVAAAGVHYAAVALTLAA